MSTKISIQIDNLDFNKRKSNTFIENDFFLIRRNKKIYAITSHNFLPIKKQIIHNDIKFNIGINSKWNEVLVLNCHEILDNIPIFNVLGTKLPTIGSNAYIQGQKVNINEYTFHNFAFLPDYPSVLYIKVKHNSPQDILSGSPLYDKKKKLIGMVSFSDRNHLYCLPSYYIIKTFEKRNRIEYPDYEGELIKINRNLVKDDKIYNPYLGINIPTSSYFMLESNRKMELTCLIDGKEKIFNETIFGEYLDERLIKNSRKIIRNKRYLELSTSTLHLLKKNFPKYCKIIMENLKNIERVNNIEFKLKSKSIKIRF